MINHDILELLVTIFTSFPLIWVGNGFVQFQNHKFKLTNSSIRSGVPQGSVLGSVQLHGLRGCRFANV